MSLWWTFSKECAISQLPWKLWVPILQIFRRCLKDVTNHEQTSFEISYLLDAFFIKPWGIVLQWFGQITPWWFFLFSSYDQIRNPWENLHQMSQSGLGIKQYLGPKSWLKIWVLGFLGLAKRLFGADSALAPRSLLARSPPHQGVFWPNPKTPKLKF